MEESQAKNQDESAKEDQPERVPLHAPDLLRWCISLLATSAWQAMGLIPDPATNKVERNLDDARLAIDATTQLVELLKPRLDDKQRRELDTLLTDLRMNFVQQQTRNQP